jgi:hypothetical protein
VLVELEGRGRSPHEIAASADGTVRVVIGSGTVDSSIIDVITADFMLEILKLLNPFAKRSDQTEFQCAVLAMEIENGQARLAPLAVQTDTTTMLGDGRIDLSTEELELDWVTKPRKGLGLSASMITNPYIKLGGTLAKPALQVKEMEAVAATGIGVATLGISFVAKGLLDRVTAENKVCDQALAKIGRAQEKPHRRGRKRR